MSEIEDGIEKTLVMIKPDAVERRLVSKIQHEIEMEGFKITPIGFISFTLPLVKEFYQWEGIKYPVTVNRYLCNEPIALWVIEGIDSIDKMMKIKLRLRKELCSGDHRNLLHCSSSQTRFKWEYSILEKAGVTRKEPYK